MISSNSSLMFYRCAACERRFDTQILLEYHKDQFAHWTEEDLAAYWYNISAT